MSSPRGPHRTRQVPPRLLFADPSGLVMLPHVFPAQTPVDPRGSPTSSPCACQWTREGITRLPCCHPLRPAHSRPTIRARVHHVRRRRPRVPAAGRSAFGTHLRRMPLLPRPRLHAGPHLSRGAKARLRGSDPVPRRRDHLQRQLRMRHGEDAARRHGQGARVGRGGNRERRQDVLPSQRDAPALAQPGGRRGAGGRRGGSSRRSSTHASTTTRSSTCGSTRSRRAASHESGRPSPRPASGPAARRGLPGVAPGTPPTSPGGRARATNSVRTHRSAPELS